MCMPASSDLHEPRMVQDVGTKISDMEKVYTDLQKMQDTTYETVPDKCRP